MNLPETEEFKVSKIIRFVEKFIQFVGHSDGAVDVKHNADDGNDDDQNIKDVPEGFEIGKSVAFDFKSLFHRIVENEQTEDCFTCHDKVVSNSNIADQFHRTEGPGWDSSSGCREFHQQPNHAEEVDVCIVDSEIYEDCSGATVQPKVGFKVS